MMPDKALLEVKASLAKQAEARATPAIDSEIYKEWEGKTIAKIVFSGDAGYPWGLGITFTDGTSYGVWIAGDELCIAKDFDGFELI